MATNIPTISQDAGLSGADGRTVLAWAAREGRALLTHDANTMTRHAYERVREGKPMPGLLVAGQGVPAGVIVEEILLLAELSLEGEWKAQVRYLPLR